jgi:hypothetical protein
MADLLKDLGIELSTSITDRDIKIMWWGDSGVRKTETCIRNFPRVLMVDAEGNSDQIDRKEVPPFLVVKTKDYNRVLQIIDLVAVGKLKFPDGSPVETLFIDTLTVFAEIGMEIATRVVEKRAEKWSKPKEEATFTQLDWTLSKRPVRRILNKFNNAGIKFLVCSCQEKDLYDDTKTGGDAKKIGKTFDLDQKAKRQFNVVLDFYWDEARKWKIKVMKVQGELKNVFPDGKEMSAFPIKELLAYASTIQVKKFGLDDEQELIEREVAKEFIAPRTQADLISYAKEKGMEPKNIGPALKAGGISEFNAARWDDMVGAINAAAQA